MSFNNWIPKSGGIIISNNKLKNDLKVWNCQKEVQSAANFTSESWKANKNPPVTNKKILWYWMLLNTILIGTSLKSGLWIISNYYFKY